MAFTARRPFIVVSFDPPDILKEEDADYIHLIRLIRFSTNFRGLLLIGTTAGQDAVLYA